MKEIEVEEYVRTTRGIIFIYDKEFAQDIQAQDFSLHNDGKIVKHSKNILDLIEDTDILQVEISEEWVAKEDTIRFIIVGQTYTIEEIKEALENGMYKIKQILTKEQFTQNCYKVEEK